jgi:hypothetical protein
MVIGTTRGKLRRHALSIAGIKILSFGGAAPQQEIVRKTQQNWGCCKPLVVARDLAN